MARSIPEIYDAIVLDKSEQPELVELVPALDSSQTLLSDLTTPSRVARWRIFYWVVAVAIWVLEKRWDLFRAEVEALAAGSYIGTLRWYVDKAKAFQYGYDLDVFNNVPAYAVDDPASRIVTRAAGKEQGGYVLLKVAKVSGTDIVPLSGPEMVAFTAYVDDVKMAGTIVNIISDNPDLLKVTATIYYNPLVMAPNGTLILSPTIKPVEVAVKAYIANLPFNGAFVLTELVDAMQGAEGVVNPVLVNAQAKYGFFAYADIDVQYITHAGHAIIDPLNDLHLTLTYVPYVV